MIEYIVNRGQSEWVRLRRRICVNTSFQGHEALPLPAQDGDLSTEMTAKLVCTESDRRISVI